MKDSVVIPFQWFEVFKECASEDLCKYLDAIKDYVQTRQEPNFHGADKYLWMTWKQRLDYENGFRPKKGDADK